MALRSVRRRNEPGPATEQHGIAALTTSRSFDRQRLESGRPPAPRLARFRDTPPSFAMLLSARLLASGGSADPETPPGVGGGGARPALRQCGAARAPSARTLAAHEMKDATELAVGVSSAGFEFDGDRRRYLLRIAGIQLDSTELEPVDEQPYPVPAQWLHALALYERTEFLHRVGASRHSQHPDLGSGVKRRQSVVPAPFQGRPHRHRLGV